MNIENQTENLDQQNPIDKLKSIGDLKDFIDNSPKSIISNTIIKNLELPEIKNGEVIDKQDQDREKIKWLLTEYFKDYENIDINTKSNVYMLQILAYTFGLNILIDGLYGEQTKNACEYIMKLNKHIKLPILIGNELVKHWSERSKEIAMKQLSTSEAGFRKQEYNEFTKTTFEKKQAIKESITSSNSPKSNIESSETIEKLDEKLEKKLVSFLDTFEYNDIKVSFNSVKQQIIINDDFIKLESKVIEVSKLNIKSIDDLNNLKEILQNEINSKIDRSLPEDLKWEGIETNFNRYIANKNNPDYFNKAMDILKIYYTIESIAWDIVSKEQKLNILNKYFEQGDWVISRLIKIQEFKTTLSTYKNSDTISAISQNIISNFENYIISPRTFETLDNFFLEFKKDFYIFTNLEDIKENNNKINDILNSISKSINKELSWENLENNFKNDFNALIKNTNIIEKLVNIEISGSDKNKDLKRQFIDSIIDKASTTVLDKNQINKLIEENNLENTIKKSKEIADSLSYKRNWKDTRLFRKDTEVLDNLSKNIINNWLDINNLDIDSKKLYETIEKLWFKWNKIRTYTKLLISNLLNWNIDNKDYKIITKNLVEINNKSTINKEQKSKIIKATINTTTEAKNLPDIYNSISTIKNYEKEKELYDILIWDILSTKWFLDTDWTFKSWVVETVIEMIDKNDKVDKELPLNDRFELYKALANWSIATHELKEISSIYKEANKLDTKHSDIATLVKNSAIDKITMPNVENEKDESVAIMTKQKFEYLRDNILDKPEFLKKASIFDKDYKQDIIKSFAMWELSIEDINYLDKNFENIWKNMNDKDRLTFINNIISWTLSIDWMKWKTEWIMIDKIKQVEENYSLLKEYDIEKRADPKWDLVVQVSFKEIKNNFLKWYINQKSLKQNIKDFNSWELFKKYTSTQIAQIFDEEIQAFN